MAITLPYPDMDFTPLDVLTATEMDQIVSNYEYIADNAMTYEDYRIDSSSDRKAIIIPNNSNLNTIQFLKVGKYFIGGDAGARTLTNCPTKSAFQMVVYTAIETSVDNESTKSYTYRVREITDRMGNKWIQYADSGATAGSFTYYDWRQIATNGPELLWSYDGTGQGTVNNWNFSIPFASLVWDSASNNAKYSKVVLNMVCEQTSGNVTSALLLAKNSGGTNINNDHAGYQFWGQTRSDICRTSERYFNIARGVMNNSMFMETEFYLPINQNWVPYFSKSFSGPIGSDLTAINWGGRLRTPANSIATISLETALPQVRNAFHVELWGYR